MILEILSTIIFSNWDLHLTEKAYAKTNRFLHLKDSLYMEALWLKIDVKNKPSIAPNAT